MTNKLTSIITVIALSSLLPVAHAERSDSQKIMEVLHSTCIQSAANNYAEIDAIVKAFEGAAMSDKLTKSDAAVSQMGGKGYWIKYEGLALGLMYAINGGCTVIAPKLNAAEMQDTLQRNYPLRLIHTESTGPQIQKNFRIENPSLYAGAEILVIHAKPEMQTEIGSVGFVSASTIRSNSSESRLAAPLMPTITSKNTKELGDGTGKPFPRAEQITQMLKNQMSFYAKLTKQEHANFWRMMNTFTSIERTHLLSRIERNFLTAAKLNIAVIESALVSAANGKFVKTTEFIELTAEARRIYLTSLPLSLSSAQKADLINVYDARRAIVDINNDNFLKSAAAGRSLVSTEPQVVAFDSESLRAHSAASRQAFNRVQKLLDPVWRD